MRIYLKGLSEFFSSVRRNKTYNNVNGDLVTGQFVFIIGRPLVFIKLSK